MANDNINNSKTKDKLFLELLMVSARRQYNVRHALRIMCQLETFPRKERQEIVCRQEEGYGPLFLACLNGHVHLVAYMVEECGADVEQMAEYDTTNYTHLVTPLWIAALEGRLDIIKILIKNNADVNALSICTGLTPVRAACSKNHYEVVKYLIENNADIHRPDFIGTTCLMTATNSPKICALLIKKGADLNAQCRYLRTALHRAIELKSFETTKLLLKNGANPFIKCIEGNDALQLACTKGTIKIVSLLIEHSDYSRVRIAETYELLGSACILLHDNFVNGLEYWEASLLIRNGDIPKTCISTPYMEAREFTSVEELIDRCNSQHAIHIQSLLIFERILGSYHPSTLFHCLMYGLECANRNQYKRCFRLWVYALKHQIEIYSIIDSTVSTCFQALVQISIDYFDFQNTNDQHPDEKINFQDVFESMKLIVCHLEEIKTLLKIRPIYKQHQENFDEILKAITYQIYLLKVLAQSSDEVLLMKQIIKDIEKMELRSSQGDTILHLAVSANTRMNITKFIFEEDRIFPNADIAELLIDCGANVEITNYSLSTPLHFVLMAFECNLTIVDLLLQHGAHIDRRNASGFRPYMNYTFSEKRKEKIFEYSTLKCLAARVLAKDPKLYSGKVPSKLEKFIKFH